MSAPEWEVMPLGGEILVNTTTDQDQFEQQIVTLAGGGFVITWVDYSDDHASIRAQIFAADGTAVGGFTITWTDASSGNTDVRAQVFEVSDGGVNAAPGAAIPLSALFEWSDAEVSRISSPSWCATPISVAVI